jgi:hypothetical protein
MSWTNSAKTAAATFTNTARNAASLTNLTKVSLTSYRLLIDSTDAFLIDNAYFFKLGDSSASARFVNVTKN